MRAVLPEILCAVSEQASNEQPGRAGHGRRRDDDEDHRDAAFDGDDPGTTVGDGEADVDGGDNDEAERVDRRRIEPPEGQWRGSLCRSGDKPPDDRHAPGRTILSSECGDRHTSIRVHS